MFYRFMFIALIMGSWDCYAQQKDVPLQRMKWQIGITPGWDNTNGLTAQTKANLSTHLLAGGAGAIQGYQISLLSNYSIYYVRGIQFSALVNVSGQQVLDWRNKGDGEELALIGAQLSVLANKVDGNAKGAQLALRNKVKGYLAGTQIGLVNSVSEFFSGFQLSGLINAVGGNYTGIQLAGLFNFSGKQGMGLQFAPINYVRTGGFQLENTPFLQRDHLQFGLININKKNTGYMIGLINISGKNEGVPLGLINIGTSRGGVTLAMDELVDTRLTINTGSPLFENRLTVGYNYWRSKNYPWVFGYGLEKNKKINQINEPFESIGTYVDLYFMKPKNGWKSGQWANRLAFYYAKDYFKMGMSILLGVSANVGYFEENELSPEVSSYTMKGDKVTFWPGFVIGIH